MNWIPLLGLRVRLVANLNVASRLLSALHSHSPEAAQLIERFWKDAVFVAENGRRQGLQMTAIASVFISYSSRDRRDAFAIKQLLESHRMEVWLDFFDIQTAADLRQQLANRVRQAGVFCLLLSPSAVESRWVGEEIATALAARPAGLRVLPIILRPCRIPAELNDIVGFDASEGLENEAVRLRLVRAACGEAAVDEGVLLDAANRMLLANKETVLRAKTELPGVAGQIARLGPAISIRRVSLTIRPETLPEDPNVILELQLEVDRLFGRRDVLLYRALSGRANLAGGVWISRAALRRVLPDRAAAFSMSSSSGSDRLVAPSVDRDGTDLRMLPATYRMEFDGASFKPKGELTLPRPSRYRVSTRWRKTAAGSD